jgi:SAM-dependent methyltransferase
MTKLIDNTRTYFFGRSFYEIIACFGLDESSLRGKQVLDCPAGPSSFAAEAGDHGFEVTAFDPMFYRGVDALRSLAYSDYETMFARVRTKPELFVKKTFESIEEAEKDRYGALELFLKDYAKYYPHGRYVTGKLPTLAFEDASFDVVLCGHLLFLYSFDFDFHLKSVLEMCRVAKEEVRIHPIVDMSGNVHAMVEPLMEVLTLHGYFPEIHQVEHEFFKGSNRTMVIRV